MRIPKRFVDDAIINSKDRHVIAAAQFHQVEVVVSNHRRLLAASCIRAAGINMWVPALHDWPELTHIGC